jgi:hypothetical protein
VIHRTFRSLDDAPKLVGFTIGQWAALIGGACVVLAVAHLAQLPSKAAMTLLVFAVGLPGALTYVSESGGLALGRLLGDVCRWRFTAKELPPADSATRCSPGVLIAGPAPGNRAPGEPAPGGESAQAGPIWERWT